MSGYIGNIPVPQATQTRDTFTATAGQTSFATSGYTPSFLDVFLNGVHLVNGTDYTATNGSDVVLSSGATAGDILEVVAYKPFEVVDQNFTGDFSVDTDTLFVDASTNSVGINNASPSSSLDVAGDAEISGDLTVDTNTLYVDSTNNRVGIGTSSPVHDLDVIGQINASSRIRVGGSAAIYAPDSNELQIGSASAGDFLTFYTDLGEAMRIDSSGDVLVGTGGLPNTSNSGVRIANPTVTTSRWSIGPSTATTTLFQFLNGNGIQGSISISASSTSYNTSSDERLKENIADAQPASDLIDGIQVREFDWKADGEHQRYGMVAQELEAVAPEAVTKGETEDDMWSVDYSKLVPMLVKEIQDLRKRVTDLENTQ